MLRAPQSMLGQLIAYAIGGGAMTLFHAAVYWLLAEPADVEPYIANSIAAIAAGLAGYVLHSKWTFGHGDRQVGAGASLLRYAIVSLLCFALNSFWVWLVVKHLGRSVAESIVPMILVTPWLAFALNRFWTFRAKG
jgi:putative flippase GtrA